MPKKKIETSKKKKVEPKYSLEIAYGDTVFKTKAETVADALKQFTASPDIPFGFKTQVIIKVATGKEERQRILWPKDARRIFGLSRVQPEALEVLGRTLTRQFET